MSLSGLRSPTDNKLLCSQRRYSESHNPLTKETRSKKLLATAFYLRGSVVFEMSIKFIATTLALFIFAKNASAQVSRNFLSGTLPKYELGAAAILINTPNYPGAKNNRTRVVGSPFYIYRGDYLRSDDEGTRARLLTSKRRELGVSLGFNFPVNSNDQPSRVGMPDLDALVSFGPRLLFRLLTESKDHKLNISFATRAVFSSKVSFNNLLRAEGFNFEPALNYWHRWHNSQTTFYTNLALEFGSAKYNQFFYNVAPEFATPTREAYYAKAGFVETALSAGVAQIFWEDWLFFTGLSWRNLAQAANRDSPLMETTDNLSIVFGAIWTFYESDDTVQAR